jgi:hypothetical protein
MSYFILTSKLFQQKCILIIYNSSFIGTSRILKISRKGICLKTWKGSCLGIFKGKVQ